MNVLQLFTTTNAAAVVETHNRLYEATPITLEDYVKTLEGFKTKPLVRSSSKVAIFHCETRYPDSSRNKTSWEVNLLKYDPEETRYSLALAQWGEILPCEIQCVRDISAEDKAAHIFYELTYYGSEEEGVTFKDDFLDTVQEIETGRVDPMRSKITVMQIPVGANAADDWMMKLFTDEEIAQIKEDAVTKQFYRDGVLQDGPSSAAV